ncbi:MAG: HAD family hydrolase [Akkermansiaceae bacterium]|jgi:beta-phosphoglucomutase-like phosphatase (HAD superfamily)
MKVVIFDINGTLTQTNAVDSECFIRTVREVLGVEEFETDWTQYQFVTDSGVAQEISQRYCDRPMSGALTKAFHEHLVNGLREQPKSLFQALPGAIDFVNLLVESPDHAVAFATGAHEASARYKLETAGFEVAGLPLASSSDAVVREHIMLHALDRAARAHQVPFSDVVYFGNAPWDVEATSNLGWKLVGIGKGIETGLRFDDYTDPSAILACL